MKKNFNYIRFLACAVILTFWILPEVKGQGYGDRNRAGGEGSFNIQGKVMMPDGRPAIGVKVTMSSADFNGGATQTDNDGNFTFASLLAGNYTISIKGGAGYEPESETMIIDRFASPGQTFNMNFFLRAPGVKKNSLNPTNNPLLNDVPKEALKKYKSAAESMQKNDLKAATIFLDEAIAIHPNFALAYNEKGMLLIKQNELDKAMEAFVKAIQINPDYFDAKLNFGFASLNKKDYEKTEIVMRDILQQRADSLTAQIYLGIALIGLKKIDEAETILKKLVSTKGGENMAQAHRYLGGIYIQRKKNAEAIAELEKYLLLAPKAGDVEKIKATIAELKK